MEKKELFEVRRQRLLQLLNSAELDANRSALATKLGISVSYVYRMLYPEGKAGKKNIGDDTVRLIASKFNGYSLDGVASTPGISETAALVAQAFDRLNSVEQTALLGVLRGFGCDIQRNTATVKTAEKTLQIPESHGKQSSRSS